MRLARGLLGVLLWIVACVVGLLGVVCCVTLILLPVGFVLLRLAGKTYGRAVALMLPRAVSHPTEAVTPSRRSRRKLAKKGRGASAAITSTVQKKAKGLVAGAGQATGIRKKKRFGLF